MSRRWIHESPARWDASKARIVAGAPPGIFDSRYAAFAEGTLVPDDWWRVEDEGRVVGHGWLDVVWGDAEILLAVAPDAQRRGVGAFILDRLEDEARTRGLGYLYNVVRPTNPRALEVSRWLEKHGFRPEGDGRLVRALKRV
jgi:ribosomal protein S18 acetylase RimI-like enzyme